MPSTPPTAAPTVYTPISIISTVAGTGSAGYSGDNGAATSATLNGPGGLALDSSGNIFFSDYRNSRVRKVSTNGIITTFAGTGSASYGGDGGPASSASFYYTGGLSMDSSG